MFYEVSTICPYLTVDDIRYISLLACVASGDADLRFSRSIPLAHVLYFNCGVFRAMMHLTNRHAGFPLMTEIFQPCHPLQIIRVVVCTTSIFVVDLFQHVIPFAPCRRNKSMHRLTVNLTLPARRNRQVAIRVQMLTQYLPRYHPCLRTAPILPRYGAVDGAHHTATRHLDPVGCERRFTKLHYRSPYL